MELPILLVVDDYPATDTIFKLCFKGRYVIVSAQTLQEAKNVIDNITVDAIILDYYLPDGLGPQLLPDIPENVPVILMTGNHDIVEKLAPSFSATFTKPYDCLIVGDTIDKLLEL